MTQWMKAALAALVVLAAGCSGAPQPAPVPPNGAPAVPAPVTGDAERRRQYDELRNSVAGIPYVVLIDFDERVGKLLVGVSTLEAKQAVQREMARLGLPEGSVVIEHPKLLLSEAAPFAGCQSAERLPGDDGRLIIPAMMVPGQEFDLMLALDAKPEEIMRGVDSYLECWDGSAWSARYMLLVGYGSPDAKPTTRISGINVVDSLGLGGPGPEKLVLPEEIPPGWYRIRKQAYAGSAQQEVTADFEVRPPAVLHVYFTPAGDQLPVTPRAVPRQVAANAVNPRTALEELLKGPTEQERSAGYFSWFSQETAGMLNSVTITAGGRAVVDFKDFSAIIPNASTSAGMGQLYRELGHTLAQFKEISEFEYRFDGSCERFFEWLQSECQAIPAARYGP